MLESQNVTQAINFLLLGGFVHLPPDLYDTTMRGLFTPGSPGNNFLAVMLRMAGQTQTYVGRDSQEVGAKPTIVFGNVVSRSEATLSHDCVILPNRDSFAGRITAGGFYLAKVDSCELAVFVSSIYQDTKQGTVSAELCVTQSTDMGFRGDPNLPIVQVDFLSKVFIPIGDVIRPAHVVPLCSDSGCSDKIRCMARFSDEQVPKGCASHCLGLAGDHHPTGTYIWNLYFVK